MRFTKGPMMSNFPQGPPKEILKLISSARGDHQYLIDISEQYGDVFSLDIGRRDRITVLASPEYIKELFSVNKKAVDSNNAELFRLLGENSLFTVSGQKHLETRKMLNEYFNKNYINNYFSLTEKIAREQIKDWPSNTIVKTRPLFMNVFRKTIQSIIFGEDRQELAAPLMRTIEEILDYGMHQSATVASFLMELDTSYTLRYLKKREEDFDKQIYEIINEIRKENNLEDKKDLASSLINHKNKDGTRLSNKEIRDHVLTIITAGHESNSVESSFLLDCLAHDKITQNYLAAYPEDSASYEMAVKEILRLKPAVHYTHKIVTQDFDLFDYSFSIGDTILISIFLTNRNPKYWDRPHEFIPARWFKKPENQYAWIPFGTGVHRCIGARLATGQLAIVTREVLKRYRLIAVNDPENFISRSIVSAPERDGELFLKAR